MAETKTRSIHLYGNEVRGIRDGRQTQIRRVVKPQPVWGGTPSCRWLDCNVEPEDQRYGVWRESGDVPCPYGVPGDRLWVKEAFYIDLLSYARGPLPKNMPAEIAEGHPAGGSWLYYRADGECCQQIPECCCSEYPGKTPWRSSIHMPRWASRLTLEVADVRVQRVRDINREDAMSEGIVQTTGHHEHDNRTSVENFAHLWDSINARRGYGWKANPWVWPIAFKQSPRACE